ncbi:MAG: AAA family ATPase [Hyphomicrobiales bacterium]|nr:AAA family ATPase [Hyphomicrobiales bacterium]MCP4998551.1 AAA family ATPase [Hyphomicrobiales bacterium]
MIVRTVRELVDIVLEHGEGRKRSIIAIAGPPGVGKSTLSSRLCRQLVAGGHSAAIVQMDGFHLDNATLKTNGLLDKKGAPETFDAPGFVSLIADLRANVSNVSVPEFDRDTDSVRSDAAIVDMDCRFVLVEGNYLLLDSAPWTNLQPLFDCRIFMTAEMNELRERLVSRWLMHGYDSDDAEAKAFGNDIPNAERVLVHSVPADVVYRPMDMADLPG